jgi:hypothetical protein
MSTMTLRLLLGLFLVLGIAAPLPALDYPANFTFKEVPNPLSGDNPRFPMPAAPVPNPGTSFFDPHFRVILARAVQGNPMRHEYSRHDPFNVDQSMIVLHTGQEDWRVYQTKPMPYDQDDNVVIPDLAMQEPRWDPKDPNLLWCLDGENFSIVLVKVATNERTVIKDFRNDPTLGPIIMADPNPGLWRITTGGELETSQDKRYWGLAIQGGENYGYQVKYLVTWDRVQDQILGLYPVPAMVVSPILDVGISPLGTWVIIQDEIANLIIADKALINFYTIGESIGHGDVALDTQGREVYVAQNANTDYVDLIPLAPTTTPVTSFGDYTGSGVIPLLRLYYDDNSLIGFKSGIHISCNYRGYALISPYLSQGEPEQNWLDQTLTLVRLDRNRPRAFYLAKIHNLMGMFPDGKNFWEETHGSISRDGAKIVWSDNWGTPGPAIDDPRGFLMQLDMPKNWQRLITGAALPAIPLLLGD